MNSETITPITQQNGSTVVVSPNGSLATEPPASTADVKLIKQDRPTELFHSYDQGMVDGVLELNTENFVRFIDAYHYREYKNKAIYHLRGQIKELLDNRTTAETNLSELKSERLGKEAKKEGLTFKIDCIDKIIAYWKEQTAEAKANAEHIKNLKTDYTLSAGLLFFFFACLFIAADYTICLSIVAETLKIGYVDSKPTFPSHLFALAMSGLAVVLKPAYDRLVEKPYHNNGNKWVFPIVILLLAFAVLAMLFALGVFREDVIHSGMLDEVDTSTDIGIDGEEVPTQQGAMVQNEWARKFGIISSTLLFAVAGAVCLGISLPILHRNFRIHWNLVVSRKRHKKEYRLQETKADLESNRATAILEISGIDEKITALKPLIEVDEQIKEKRQMILVYQHGEMVKNIAKSTEIYLAGYERGKKLIGKVPQEWLFDSVYSVESKIERNTSIALEPNKARVDSNIMGKRTRPFVALRRMITHNFKKKWDKENDINIEYYNFDN